MRKLGVVLALALSPALAGCPPGDVWTSRVEEPNLPPPPPEHLLRKPPDFRLLDPHLKKEFHLYLYEDEAISQEIVTVINKALPPKEQAPRLATKEEHDYAIALFLGDWRSRGEEGKIRYFNERHAQELARNATLLDYQIVYKEQEIADLQEQVLDLTADLKSRGDTGTFAGGDEKFDLAPTPAVEAELARSKRRLAVAQAQLSILQYKRDLRDSQFTRIGATYSDSAIECGDVAKHYSGPDRFVEDVRMHVQPASWTRDGVRLSYSDGKLHVRNTRDVVVQTREYVDALRAEWKAREAAAAQQPPKPQDAAPK